MKGFRILLDCLHQAILQVQVQVAFHHQAQNAVSGTPYAQRIPSSGRYFAYREDPGQHVQPVGQGQHLARQSFRQRVIRIPRPVVV